MRFESMTIAMRDIFTDPIDRAIDGVIKADDEESLRIELDEYVITGEIGLRLEQFLDAYNNYKTANGVWISGFFGSGKSHLLKMLALLLENREVDGVKAFDIFAEKLKNEPMLAGPDEGNISRQRELLDSIITACTGTGVEFSWAFDTSGAAHARDIVTDTGWKIVLDRGLDIFQPPIKTEGFSLGDRLQDHRTIKGFYVTYVKAQN